MSLVRLFSFKCEALAGRTAYCSQFLFGFSNSMWRGNVVRTVRWGSSAGLTASTEGERREKKLVKVHVKRFVDGEEEARIFDAPVGMTLMEALRDIAKVDIEAACDGTCACSTCHVILDDHSFSQLGADAVSEEEQDMLDLASSLSPTSRLSCQVQLTEKLEELRLVIPNDEG